ncbi:MAG TPA: helix-turn-helix domain-containing protein, partial [Agromyces sp.]|nr:helix-turn-helix domain-containing protein [Agromyces sp.]
MAGESTGRGEPDRTLRLLWRARIGEPTGSRGPKQRSSVDEVVGTAIQLADEEGIEALSMRRIADRLGLKPMSVYTYVPGKAELIDLMVDQVAGEVA